MEGAAMVPPSEGLMPDGYGGPHHARTFLAFIFRFFSFLRFYFWGGVPVPTGMLLL